jgi:hypothetical protein
MRTTMGRGAVHAHVAPPYAACWPAELGRGGTDPLFGTQTGHSTTYDIGGVEVMFPRKFKNATTISPPKVLPPL